MFITEAVAPVVWTIDTAGNGRKNYRRIAWSIKDGHDWISDGIAGWWAAIRYGQPLGRWLNPDFSGWRRHDTLDPDCRRNIVGEFSRRCERAGELRSDTSWTGAHRLLPRPKSVLSGTIGSCRCQSACAIRRRVVSGNYRNRPSETQTTSATINSAREKCSVRQITMTISLAFLAPNLVKAAVEGRLPRGIGIERLRDPPTEWSRQFDLAPKLVKAAVEGPRGMEP